MRLWAGRSGRGQETEAGPAPEALVRPLFSNPFPGAGRWRLLTFGLAKGHGGQRGSCLRAGKLALRLASALPWPGLTGGWET